MILFKVKQLYVEDPSEWKGYHKHWGHVSIRYKDNVLSFYRYNLPTPFFTKPFSKVLYDSNYITWETIRPLVTKHSEKENNV